MADREFTPAKRGDLVIVHTRHRDFVIGQPDQPERDEYTVGLVTGITRDGIVRTYRAAYDTAEFDYAGRPNKGTGLLGPKAASGVQGWAIVSQAQIDAEGAMATAACHVYEGHEQTKAYGSLDEVKAALAPHRTDAPTRGALAEAAAGWKLAHLAADRMLREDNTAANRAHREIGYHTREGDATRTRMDREASERHSERVRFANLVYRATYAGLLAQAEFAKEDA